MDKVLSLHTQGAGEVLVSLAKTTSQRKFLGAAAAPPSCRPLLAAGFLCTWPPGAAMLGLYTDQTFLAE